MNLKVLEGEGQARERPLDETEFKKIAPHLQAISDELSRNYGIKLKTKITRVPKTDDLLPTMVRNPQPKGGMREIKTTFRMLVLIEGEPEIANEPIAFIEPVTPILIDPSGNDEQFVVTGRQSGSRLPIQPERDDKADLAVLIATQLFDEGALGRLRNEKLKKHKEYVERLKEECKGILENEFEAHVMYGVNGSRINIYKKPAPQEGMALFLEVSPGNTSLKVKQTVYDQESEKQDEHVWFEIVSDEEGGISLEQEEVREALSEVKTYTPENPSMAVKIFLPKGHHRGLRAVPKEQG